MYHQIARNQRRSAVVVACFVLVWIGIGALIGLATSGAATGMVAWAAVFAVLAGLAAVFALRRGDRMVLALAGARPADPVAYVQVHNIVEALSIGAGIPKPAVYVIDDPSPNAFATGTTPQKASVAVTTGLLEMMNREELEGVLGHEMSHVRNYDVRLLLVVSTLIALAALLASIVWQSLFSVRMRGRDSAQIYMAALVIAGLLSVVAVVVGPLMQLALSRSRESLADASSVELTRNPAGLLHALQKLAANDKPLQRVNHATAAMCIDDPLAHHEGWWHRLFDTHPPIQERIAALQRIAAVQEV